MPLNTISPILAAILLAGLLTSCGETATPWRDYYYPLRALEEGLVYEYRAAATDSLAPDYWYYKSIPTDSALYLTKTYYTHDYVQRVHAREEMVPSGILLDELFIMDADSTGKQTPVAATIESANVFPFSATDTSTIYLYKVTFELPSSPGTRNTLIINRKLAGETTYTYKGQSYPAVRFALRGVQELRDPVKGDIEGQFVGEEIYAKGLGLVAYSRQYLPQTKVFTYTLHDQYPMATLENKARQGN